MARRKKPEDETHEDMLERQQFDRIANASNRSEKTSWNRKQENMVSLLVELEPIEDEILAIIEEKKTPLMNKVTELRNIMVHECVHPFEYLVTVTGNVVLCKFCDRKITTTST